MDAVDQLRADGGLVRAARKFPKADVIDRAKMLANSCPDPIEAARPNRSMQPRQTTNTVCRVAIRWPRPAVTRKAHQSASSAWGFGSGRHLAALAFSIIGIIGVIMPWMGPMPPMPPMADRLGNGYRIIEQL